MTAVLERVERSWLPISDVLRVPQSHADYDELVVLLDQLIDEVGEDESHPLASFMDVVGVLVERFEADHIPELS
jgi:HTH-type transcriptional regulator / antitoxin HigA